jgi:hypothetical protein
MMDIREMDIALRAYETKTELDHTKFIVFSGHLDSCAHDKVIQMVPSLKRNTTQGLYLCRGVGYD